MCLLSFFVFSICAFKPMIVCGILGGKITRSSFRMMCKASTSSPGSIKQVGTIVTSSVGNTYCYLDFFAYDDEAYRLVCREASGAEGTVSVLDLGTFQAPS